MNDKEKLAIATKLLRTTNDFLDEQDDDNYPPALHSRILYFLNEVISGSDVTTEDLSYGQFNADYSEWRKEGLDKVSKLLEDK